MSYEADKKYVDAFYDKAIRLWEAREYDAYTEHFINGHKVKTIFDKSHLETEARQFALYFLVPEWSLRAAYSKLRDPNKVALHHGISTSALGVRIRWKEFTPKST